MSRKFFTINHSGTKAYFNGLVKQLDDDDDNERSVKEQSYDEELIFDVTDFVKLKIDNDYAAKLIKKSVVKPSNPGVFNIQVNIFF